VIIFLQLTTIDDIIDARFLDRRLFTDSVCTACADITRKLALTIHFNKRSHADVVEWAKNTTSKPSVLRESRIERNERCRPSAKNNFACDVFLNLPGSSQKSSLISTKLGY